MKNDECHSGQQQIVGDALVRLGSGQGASHADQARSLGLVVGDTIVGKEYYGEDGWSEAELTLLWIGKEVCVWRQRWRNAHRPDLWYNGGERPNWSLTSREWFRKANVQAHTRAGEQDSAETTDSLFKNEL